MEEEQPKKRKQNSTKLNVGLDGSYWATTSTKRRHSLPKETTSKSAPKIEGEGEAWDTELPPNFKQTELSDQKFQIVTTVLEQPIYTTPEVKIEQSSLPIADLITAPVSELIPAKNEEKLDTSGIRRLKLLNHLKNGHRPEKVH